MPTYNEWASVKDELPNYMDNVLIYVPELKEPVIGFYDRDRKHWYAADDPWWGYQNVTHWMLLPNPPEEQKQ